MKYIFGVLIFFTSIVALANNCVNGYKPIRLELSSAELLYEPLNGGFAAVSTQLVNRIGSELPVFQAAIQNTTDFRKYVKLMHSECYRIADLSLLNHGFPGLLNFGNENIEASNVINVLSDLKNYFTADVKIKLNACYFGRGCLGRFMMLALTKYLSTQRAQVTALTEKGYSWFRIAPYVPANLQYQVLNSDVINATVKWKNNLNSCSEDYKNKKEVLKKYFRSKEISIDEKRKIEEIMFKILNIEIHVKVAENNFFVLSDFEFNKWLNELSQIEDEYQAVRMQWLNKAGKEFYLE